jgi:hypothetical protein
VTQALAAGQAKEAARSSRVVSLSASTSPGESDAMYTVPWRSRLLITQACVEHVAMDVTLGDRVLTYRKEGCTDFGPGFVVASGETLTCMNESGLERTCAVVGILEPVELPTGPRVRFYDVR